MLSGNMGIGANGDLSRGAPGRGSLGLESVSKALELLCCFAPDHPEWGVTEMAEYLGLCKSSVHRILVTLEWHRFITRTSSRHYRLGSRVLELGNVYRINRRVLTRAEPILRSLSEETGALVHLAELDGREVLELLRSGGSGAVVFRTTPAFRMPVHATALGKALLAAGGDAAVDQFVGRTRCFRGFTPFTITLPVELREEVRKVIRTGYAVSDQEVVVGCRCVAVAARSQNRKAVAAMSISGTTEKLSDARLPALVSMLSRAARAIESEL